MELTGLRSDISFILVNLLISALSQAFLLPLIHSKFVIWHFFFTFLITLEKLYLFLS